MNLYVWNPRVRTIQSQALHDFAVFNLDKNTLKTFYPKPIDKIMENFDPDIHAKIILLLDQYISKGATMITDLDVRQYEYILDYFEDDDATDEQEMFNRLGMEKEWDSIPDHFKQRILAVDKVVLQKYANAFDYNVFNQYIDTIKKRTRSELDKQTKE